MDLRETLDLLESKVVLEHVEKKDHLGFRDPKGRLDRVVKMYVKLHLYMSKLHLYMSKNIGWR